MNVEYLENNLKELKAGSEPPVDAEVCCHDFLSGSTT